MQSLLSTSCGSAGFRPVCSIEEALASSSLRHANLDPSSMASHTIVRSKTYTSNVMDETRSRRIREHFAFNKAKKAWRAEVHRRVQNWRGEQRAAALARDASMQLGVHTGGALQRNLAEQHALSFTRSHLSQLEDEVRRAQLDHDVVRDLLQGLVCRGKVCRDICRLI